MPPKKRDPCDDCKTKSKKKSKAKKNNKQPKKAQPFSPPSSFYTTSFMNAPVRAYIPQTQFIMSPYNEGLVPDTFRVDTTAKMTAMENMVKSLQQDGLSHKQAVKVINDNLKIVDRTILKVVQRNITKPIYT